LTRKLGKINLFWRINENIRVPEVRLVGSDSKQIGVVKIEEALEKAKSEGLTLVEIAPNAKPPVAKIVEFSKFKYQEEKKAKAIVKKQKGGELKEIRFSPFIAEGDYQTRLKRVREFLTDKNKVKVVVVFMGRQMGSKPMGYQLIERIVKDLGESIVMDMKPKFLGRYLVTIISPTFKKSHAKNENKEVAQ
jgi:translation initiation factor IF-3